MAKQGSGKRGRPKLAEKLDHRILCRMNAATAEAIKVYADRVGVETATALRMIAIEKMRAEKLLK